MATKILGLITARGGSKSIPRKNVLPFCGKPLLEWTIEAGLKSGVLDRFIISTDDQEIADIAKKKGVEVPFMRPAELSTDTVGSLPVLQHAVEWLKHNEGYEPDYVLLLEPTSPGRQAFHVKEAIELAMSSGADSVVGVGEVASHHNPYWQLVLDPESKATLFTGERVKNVIPRRQDLPKTYFRNGALYLFKTKLLFGNPPSLYGDDVRGYVIDQKYSMDIDTPEDWTDAEKKFIQILDENV